MVTTRRFERGERVRLRGAYPGDPLAGVTGVVVKRTFGHRAYKVWLDRRVRARVGSDAHYTLLYLAECTEHEIERTTDGPEYLVRPPEWKNLARFNLAVAEETLAVVFYPTLTVVGSGRLDDAYMLAERLEDGL